MVWEIFSWQTLDLLIPSAHGLNATAWGLYHEQRLVSDPGTETHCLLLFWYQSEKDVS